MPRFSPARRGGAFAHCARKSSLTLLERVPRSAFRHRRRGAINFAGCDELFAGRRDGGPGSAGRFLESVAPVRPRDRGVGAPVSI